jgi:thioesterase domain-containing protein/acyl carrier protein
MDEFLASLNLVITVAPPAPAEIPRTAQLTFRTNQFNTTTRRRAEAELASLLAAGTIEALAVTVADRFGDYGLVGVVLFDLDASGDAIRADTFLLSCRVLQRGVEHRMVARLGEIALERGLGHVTLPFLPTAKNQPARDFLRSLGEEHLVAGEAGAFTVRLPAAVAAALVYRPSATSPSEAANQAVDDVPRKATSGDAVPSASRHALFERLAREVHTAEQIHAIVQPERGLRARPEGAPPLVAARDALEHDLLRLCEAVIGVQPIGVTDDLFLDFGADSLAGVRLAKEIHAELGHRVEVVTVLEARTVERLARAIRGENDGAHPASRSSTLYTYRRGGDKRPLFLVRPASSSGGSLSYVALARSVDRARPLHTFLNRPLLDGSAPYASIEAMADEYVAAMRAEQPRGPYLLAGWCLGGKVAFEMANRLANAGEEVATLVLFDTLPPSSRRARLRQASERATRKAALAVYSRFPRVVETRAWQRLARAVPPLRAGREKNLAARFQGLAYWAPELDDAALIAFAFPGMFDDAALRRMPAEARWEHVFTELKKTAGSAFDGEISGAAMRRGYQALAWDHQLDAAYSPRASYPGEVHLFTVRGGAARADGWQALCRRRVEAHEFAIQRTSRISDPHNAMMQRENVPLFADALNRVLDAADAHAGSGRRAAPETRP